MQRGVISLDKLEIQSFISKVDIQKYAGSPLFEKLNAAMQSIENPLNVEVSADEVEIILDEIAIPDVNDSAAIVLMKFQQQ